MPNAKLPPGLVGGIVENVATVQNHSVWIKTGGSLKPGAVAATGNSLYTCSSVDETSALHSSQSHKWVVSLSVQSQTASVDIR